MYVYFVDGRWKRCPCRECKYIVPVSGPVSYTGPDTGQTDVTSTKRIFNYGKYKLTCSGAFFKKAPASATTCATRVAAILDMLPETGPTNQKRRKSLLTKKARCIQVLLYACVKILFERTSSGSRDGLLTVERGGRWRRAGAARMWWLSFGMPR